MTENLLKIIFTNDFRQDVNLNTTELYELAHIFCPLIKQGQSIYTILQNHPEITQCEKTIYTYIEMGLFKDWGVTNLKLHRKVKRKINRTKLKKRAEPADYTGRKYEDYLDYFQDKLSPNILNKLNIQKFEKDKVTLQPYLLNIKQITHKKHLQ